jgi:pimeloyl-ACP methyl ester carboxylesterase
LSAIGTSFGKILPTFAKTRQVIAVKKQAHGHAADVDRPLIINKMADDTVALLKQLDIKEAGFFGYSMGDGIGLHIAI